MRTNIATIPNRLIRNTGAGPRTHEGAPAFAYMTDEEALRRSVMSCMLFEDEFYEDGVAIATRISELAMKVSPQLLASIAVEARTVHNLRHAPLLLLQALSKTGAGKEGVVSNAVAGCVKRADEMAELLAMLFKNQPRRKLPAGVRKGLEKAFVTFDEYQLAKYDREAGIKLRDVLRLVRPKPIDDAQSALFKRVKDRALAVPDTWEVALSRGADKNETFTRLIEERKIGYLALLRNLRNMEKAGVDPELVRKAIVARRGARYVLPFRYTAAARAVPQFEPWIDQALQAAIAEAPVLPGKTIILVDVSSSMDMKLSGKSDLSRMDAAATLASIINAEDLRIFSFSNNTVEVAPRRGMAGVDAVITSQMHSGTRLGDAVRYANRIKHDRLVVISDEQTADIVPAPEAKKAAYMINVAASQYGVGYGNWIHVDGFSENVIRFIQEYERASFSS